MFDRKGIHAATPQYTTARAAALIDIVHIDTAGPFSETLGGSRYVVMFVDISRLQRPYRTRDKSASAILGVTKRFVANSGISRIFRTDSGAEYTDLTFVNYCNGLGIRPQLKVPYKSQQSSSVKSGLGRQSRRGTRRGCK